MFYHQICQQNELIRGIKETLSQAVERIASHQQPTVKDLPSTTDFNTAVTTAAQLKKHLCGEATHRYSLEPVSEVLNPAYKERAFSMLLQLIDADGKNAVLDKGVFCKILIFTKENPPKVIKINTVGDKILKGNTEVHGNSRFFFRNIAIREVSSHFRDGCFFVVAMPSDTIDIAPFIMDNFVVKARKVNVEVNSSKKIKFDQDTLSKE